MFIVVSFSPQTFTVHCVSKIGTVALKRIKYLARSHLIVAGRRSSMHIGSLLHLGHSSVKICIIQDAPSYSVQRGAWFLIFKLKKVEPMVPSFFPNGRAEFLFSHSIDV